IVRAGGERDQEGRRGQKRAHESSCRVGVDRAATHDAVRSIYFGYCRRVEAEVVIVGAGVAGASLAYFLAEAGVKGVLLIEREERPAHHASGRSAEALVEVDPDPLWQRLVDEG